MEKGLYFQDPTDECEDVIIPRSNSIKKQQQREHLEKIESGMVGAAGATDNGATKIFVDNLRSSSNSRQFIEFSSPLLNNDLNIQKEDAFVKKEIANQK